MKIELTQDEAALVIDGIKELITRRFDELNAKRTRAVLNTKACLSVLEKMVAEARTTYENPE